MRRREFIAMAGGAAAPWPLAAYAQQVAVPVIGFLSPNRPQSAESFRSGLRDLGYIDGQNIRIEYRWADGDFARFPSLATDLVKAKVNVLVGFVTQAALAAKAATSTIPIVMIGVADPVGVGLIASLSHPGGNITGTSSLAADIVGKQLEILLETRPRVS
jgi:putative ABC transport system substrate-binding protein